LLVGLDGQVKIKVDGQADSVPVTLRQLAVRVRQAQRGDADVPVLISAERKVAYEAVVEVMSRLQSEGIKRVALSVKAGR
jgi:biopolymer transport protein TolR